MRKLLFLISAFIISDVAHAQAFGVKKGVPVTQYGGRPINASSQYHFAINVPTPNGEFESYMAIATPETGICKVTGLGLTHRNDTYGSKTIAAFQALKSALRSRYGSSTDYNHLQSGAMWKKPNEWVWSIYKDERRLVSYWFAEKGASLPSGVTSISLTTKAVGPESPYLTLTYEFDNIDRCLAIVQNEDAEGL
jgi:hypothetical protein